MSATLPGANPTPLPPALLAGRYRLERRLAQGGMAEVWLATDLSLTRQVAVKLLKPLLAADPVVAERFRREAIAVAQLSHPNIVAVYDAIEEQIGGERRQAVVMQLVNGKSLRQLLDEQKRLSPDLTIHIGACVAAALDCAHRAHLVHRDVKPGNILITPDGLVLLTDFGIAKGLAGSNDDDLTSPNVMMGTAKYLSPEQVRGRRLDGRADLYSLGLVLYGCLAGRVPFLGETDADTALARLNRDPTDLTRLRPTLPFGLAPLIHRLLSRKPDDRYASGADVRAELQRIAGQPRTDDSRDVTRGTTPARGAARTTGSNTTVPNAATPNGTTPNATTPNATTPNGTTPNITAPNITTPNITAPPRRVSTPVASAHPIAAVGGYHPAGGKGTNTGTGGLKAGRPAGAPLRADRTPTSPVRPRQQPNRQFEHRTGPSAMVVGGLLVMAFVVGIVLWVTMGQDSNKGIHTPATTVVPGAPGTTPATQAGAGAVGAGIVALHSFDPDGDRQEHDDTVGLAIDHQLSTAWTTVCYADKYLGGKHGVGLVADLGTPSTGTFTAAIGSAPYQVRIYAAPDGAQPTTFAAWGAPVQSFDGTSPTSLSVQLTTPMRWVLVSFTELGKDPGCNANPYRGAIRELTFG